MFVVDVVGVVVVMGLIVFMVLFIVNGMILFYVVD